MQTGAAMQRQTGAVMQRQTQFGRDASRWMRSKSRQPSWRTIPVSRWVQKVRISAYLCSLCLTNWTHNLYWGSSRSVHHLKFRGSSHQSPKYNNITLLIYQ
jgi:hypothetical protein